MATSKKIILIILVLFFCLPIPFLTSARGVETQKETTYRLLVHLLGYLASDYSSAVTQGKVTNPSEFQEMQELTRLAIETAKDSPPEDSWQKKLPHLMTLLEKPATEPEWVPYVQSLREEVLQISKIKLIPSKAPNLARGKKHYDQNCASCHGVTGHGDGPAGQNLQPPPTNFFGDKIASLSTSDIYNTVRLGIPRTPMPAFGSSLDNDSLWDVSFYVHSLHAENTTTAPPSTPVPFRQVVTLSNENLIKKYNLSAEQLAHVRTHFPRQKPFELALDLLQKVQTLTQQKNWPQAIKEITTFYLDGVEPWEPGLRVESLTLLTQIESKTQSLRSLLHQKADYNQTEVYFSELFQTLHQAQSLLMNSAPSWWAGFWFSFGILFREALESVLVLVTLLGILRALPTSFHAQFAVHVGWILALLGGLLLWFFSSWVLGNVSGVTRELLEGILTVIALVFVLFFGLWLHQNSEAQKWKTYLQKQIKSALHSGSFYSLGVISFLGVFRESLETVVFLRALELRMDPSHLGAIGWGVFSSMVVIFLVAYLLLKTTAKLPIRQFFSISSFVLMLLAFVLVGKAVHAFQEIGWIAHTPFLSSLEFHLLGLYPNYQSLGSQFLLAAILIAYHYRNTVFSQFSSSKK